jgi:hypothetical protein
MKPRILPTLTLTAAVVLSVFFTLPVRSIENSSGIKVAAPKPNKTVWISHQAGEVLKLVRAGVANEVVMAYVKNSKSGFDLSADAIIHLHNEGVSDELINEMLARKKQTPPVIIAAPQPQQQQPSTVFQPAPQSVVTQPAVTYVQPQTVYVPAPTTYVYRSPAYTYYDSYPYYGRSHWYPRVSFNFGFGHHHHFRHYFGRHHHWGFRGGHHHHWGRRR